MTLTRTIEVENITPEELAEVFCEMWAKEQAAFFKHIGVIAKGWEGGAPWCGQSYAINAAMDDDSKDVVRTLARHVFDRDDI